MPDQNIIKLISLNHIDKENDTVIPKNVAFNDAKDYVNDLANKMLENTSMREYQIKTSPNPIISQIGALINNTLQAESMSETAATSDNNIFTSTNPEYVICNRLLESQKTAQARYNKITKIRKGSVIQSLLKRDTELIYIIALVEHSTFIDETDLIKKMGLPDSAKATLKSARIHFNSDLSVKKIFLSDSQTKIVEYWYDGFLDLVEAISDISNTSRAYSFIKGILSNKLSRNYKQDHLEYTNSLNVYFNHNKNFNFNECLDFIFEAEPSTTEINTAELKQEIIDKKTSKINFDNIFSVDNTDIKNSLANTKYTLNSNVELKIKTTTDTIKESIYTHRLENGEFILAIRNVDVKELKRFNFLNIDL